jgi:D-alanyl-D-alanine carboxypeptidase/D-alanyl-D-alanine-endopeptidase (penicillin-binding protein 4)
MKHAFSDWRWTAVWLAAAILPGWASEHPSAAKLEAVMNGPEFPSAHWGILVVERDSGKVLYEQNAGQLFIPASVTKLYSVAAALDTFGPDHRFETTVYRSGEIGPGGELDGDVILVAGGDLTLGGRSDSSGGIVFTSVDHTYANDTRSDTWTAVDPLAGLNELARQVATAGIKRVRGDVLIDDRLFEKGVGDEGASGPSAVTPIIVNDNVIDFLITPGKAGSPATVEWRPKTSVIDVDARVETGEPNKDPDIKITSHASGRIVVRGRIAEGARPLVRVEEVADPAAFARGLFIESLQRAGVTVDASPLAAHRPDRLPPSSAGHDAGRRIASLKSPPFSEEAKLILKVSHNLHAGVLPILVALKHGKRSLADGLRLQHDFLVRAGVDVGTISFADGVGGSRGDSTTPRATVQLLRHMSTRPDFPAYEAALPVIGVDGTLAKVVGPNSPAQGKVRAKTGTLYWENTMNGGYLLMSKALAGYLDTAGGRRLAFAMFVNNVLLKKSSETTRVGATLGRLCEIICESY